MEETPKFCRDCKYYGKIPFLSVLLGGVCNHSNNIKYNLETGKPFLIEIEPSNLRKYPESFCGPTGKAFKPKNQ